MRYSIFASLVISVSLNANDLSLLDSLNKDITQTAKIATQSNQNIDYQPFILSVLDSETLSKFGVRTLGQSLKLIPGVDMATNTMNNRTPIFRGSNPTAYGQSTLVIDGVVVNDSLFSNFNAYLDMPIELIERIEVVRGSGSFIEGINGYAGTINVVTRSSSSSFNNQDGSLNITAGSDDAFGISGWRRYNGENWKLSLDVFGYKHNQQSPIEVKDLFSSTISPSGYANLGARYSGGSVLYTYKNFELLGRINQYKSDSAFGNLNALPNDGGELQQPSWYLEGKYTLPLTSKNDLTLKTSVMEDQWQSDSRALPAGYSIFTDGYWASLMIRFRRINGSGTYHYNEWDDHQITAGFESSWQEAIDMHSITTNKDTGTGDVDYTSSSRAFIDANGAKRQMSHLYVADNITLSEHTALALTLGQMRASDVHAHVYGRAALVYQPDYLNIFKVMAANGVRFPSMQEMHVTPSAYATGNSSLTHEHVRSIEGQYLRKLKTNLTAGINLFFIENSQQIVRDSSGKFQNFGENNIQGGEVELRGTITGDDSLLFSYSYIDGNGKNTSGQTCTIPNAASHLIKASYAYDFYNSLTLGGTWNYIGTKKRSCDDTRPEFDDSNTLNVALGWGTNHSHGWYVQGIIDNITNTILRYPSPVSTYPDDYPTEGRTFWVRTGWRF